MKKLLVLLFSCCLSLSLTFNTFALGWMQDAKGWWYENEDGTYKTNEWFTSADGKSYYFGTDGYMLVSTRTPDGYLVGADGAWIPEYSAVQTSSGNTAQAGSSSTRSAAVRSTAAETKTSAEVRSSYVLNTNSRKFHKPTCSSVDKMKETNIAYQNSSREEIIRQGYSPCKICNP